MALRLLGYRLLQRFGAQVKLCIFHLRAAQDAEQLVEACRTERPQLVAFSEFDILVSQVRELAGRLKGSHPKLLTMVGGKQTSLLSVNDRFPYSDIDYAIAGCGVDALCKAVKCLLEGQEINRLPGQVISGPDGRITELVPQGVRDRLDGICGADLRAIPLRGPTPREYQEELQRFPAPVAPPIRTSAVLWSTGCTYSCSFCQSPAERERDGAGLVNRNEGDIADEIEILVRNHQTNSIFALAANLDLSSVERVQQELSRRGIPGPPIAGFVRAADVVEAASSGLLERLARGGMGALSIGFDTNKTQGDPFGKGFSHSIGQASLDACWASGIPATITVVGDTLVDRESFRQSLAGLVSLPVLGVDVRLSTAFRGTRHFAKSRSFLLRDPDGDPQALEGNDYRHHTLACPGSITTDQIMVALAEFYDTFRRSPARKHYRDTLVRKRPSLALLFEAE